MTTSVYKNPRIITIYSLATFGLFAVIFLQIMGGIWLGKQFLPFDQAVNQWMAAHQAAYATAFFSGITYLGEKRLLAALVPLIAAGLWFSRRRLEGVVFFGGFVGMMGCIHLLKSFTVRARPMVASLHDEAGSFPSGHATLSLFFFGFLVYLLSRRLTEQSHRIFLFAGYCLLVALVGISRLYLNRHWASDVLAGFALAAGLLSLCVGVIELQKGKLR